MKPNIHLPTLRQLQYLVAVVELKHFGKAAERCFVSQSTLSAGIQELEELLDNTLLERNKRRVMPTPIGEEIADKARQLLALAVDLAETGRPPSGPLSGRLSIGVIPTIGPFLLPKVLPRVRASYPELELILVEDQSARLVQKVESGDLEAAILAFPYPLATLRHQIFWRENFCVAMPREHPLASAKSLSTRNLPGDELLLLEEGHCLTDHALAACHLEGLRGHAAFQGTSLYTLLQMVAGGQGLTFVPQMALSDALLQSDEIHITELAESGPHREIGLVWRSTYHRVDDLGLLTSAFSSALQALGTPGVPVDEAIAPLLKTPPGRGAGVSPS
jgi:LysR family hydrogen peroxide-inducible transcriptional activator